MSRPNAEKLKAMIESDPELAKKVRSSDAAALEALAESLEVPCTMAELRSVLTKPQEALSEDELAEVAGGLVRKHAAACGVNNTLLTTCTKVTTTTTPNRGSVLFRG